MKKMILCLAAILIFSSLPVHVYADDELGLNTPSAILMESKTGTILYEKNSHEQLRPASITKIMTLILIFEAIERGQIALTDEVTVSEHAAGMGGSQVFLEPGETQTVQELIKCISIASANDACVAMAEYVGGTEEAFVSAMNEKASVLGMNDTHFVNSCGLEADGHLTSAYDIALMSRDLSVNHPQIFAYCTTWMDTITHKTKKGESEFGLTNTNKLIRYYSYATGLKTGYTSQSKYCLSATATKEDVDLIAVVMAEDTPTLRTKEAISLLDYGFSHCKVYHDADPFSPKELPVLRGKERSVMVDVASDFSYVITNGLGTDGIHKTYRLPAELTAPVKQKDRIGEVIYYLGDKRIASVDLIATKTVEKQTFGDCLRTIMQSFYLS